MHLSVCRWQVVVVETNQEPLQKGAQPAGECSGPDCDGHKHQTSPGATAPPFVVYIGRCP